MSKKINFDTSLGEFVAKYPQTRDIFKQFELDYCCGGKKNIALATMEKHIDWDEFKATLQKIIDETPKKETQAQKKWENESLTSIIDYILKKHHALLWKKMASTEFLLNKLIDVHAKKHGDFLIKLKDLYMDFKEKVELHLLSEENTVFNYIKELEALEAESGKKPVIERRFTQELIDVLSEDHEEVGEILRQIKDFTSGYDLPEYACASFAKLYADLETVEDDLYEHIHLENTILFPRIKKLIE